MDENTPSSDYGHLSDVEVMQCLTLNSRDGHKASLRATRLMASEPRSETHLPRMRRGKLSLPVLVHERGRCLALVSEASNNRASPRLTSPHLRRVL